jgi:hypothetical protein
VCRDVARGRSVKEEQLSAGGSQAHGKNSALFKTALKLSFGNLTNTEKSSVSDVDYALGTGKNYPKGHNFRRDIIDSGRLQRAL